MSVVTEVRSRFGKLHVLVNNAGIAIAGSVLTMTLADWRRQQSINLDGVFLGVKHSLPLMRESGGGSIINISSLAGPQGFADAGRLLRDQGRRAALHQGGGDGVRRGARQCAGQFGPSRHHRDADLAWHHSRAIPGASQPGSNAPNLDQISELVVPIGKKGLPEDIAAGVLYLASDDSRYVTGSELVIDGGMSTR